MRGPSDGRFTEDGMSASHDDTDDLFRRRFSEAEMSAMRRAAKDEAGVLSEAMGMLRRLGRKLPFAEDALAAFYCATDPQTDKRVKLVLVGALAYFVMPFDVIPDVLPLLGFTDDAAVIATALSAVSRAMKPEHRERAKQKLDEA
jgi:uncharacterized membrane protein YkvA (DUF1232 family)